MAVSRRLRFEILRRDDHTCRYCGKRAPSSELTVDHVVPVALGGRDDPENLVTACRDCNMGKASIAPGSPLVAQVQEDSLRWARAIETAATFRRADREVVEAALDRFDWMWVDWKVGGPEGAEIPRQTDWRESIERFLGAGLDVDEMVRLIGVAMRKPTVNHEDRWTYFCGCCWRAIDDLQAAAKSIIQAEDDIEEWRGPH